MSKLRCALAGAIVLLAQSASAGDRIGIHPGMSFADVDAVLRPRCVTYVVSGKREKFITCHTDTDPKGGVISATVSPKDRTMNVVLAEPLHGDVGTYGKELAAELGYRGDSHGCTLWDEPMQCWDGADGTVMSSGAIDPEGRFVTYFKNDGIKREDGEN